VAYGKRQLEVRVYRGQMPSPGRPSVAWREDRVRFWAGIAAGAMTEDAAAEAGVSSPVGFRWFRHAGDVNPRLPETISGRYLSSNEREDIALWRAQGAGVREIAGRLGRAPSTVFYFRERHGEWRIELDLRPNGRFARVFRGTDANGDARYEQFELDEGDVIAYGTTADEGYGTTPLERAQFIVDIIRIHLARQACTHHRNDLPTIQAVLGTQLRWCPTCGTRLPTR